MIVKNEEELLARCLDSVVGFDELVIVDTGSEDSTVEIAKKYTDKVFFFEWCDSFCKARNFANSKVSKDIDWVFTIDADEYLETPVSEIYEVAKASHSLAVNIKVKAEKTGDIHYFPRLFRNDKAVFWVNDIHNLLNIPGGHNSDITTVYGYSPAHKKDPDRALRILTKSLQENPKLIREKYYLGREYYYRRMWVEALEWLDKYVTESKFLSERNDAYLMRARCLSGLKRYSEACDSAWQALKYNANFKEALLFIAEHMDNINSRRWNSFAQLADNSNVLFVRTPHEQPSTYYDSLFEKDNDMSRYRDIYEEIGEMVGDSSVLDIGCGLAELRHYIKDYSGFDFSKKAIETVGDSRVWLGNAYDKENYVPKDVYVCTEVLEHLDDIRVFDNIPSGKKVVFSVPSFTDPSHLRTYTEEIVRGRLPVRVDEVYRFNWDGKAWRLGGKETSAYILLVVGVRL